MSINVIFNITVCLVGIIFLTIHAVDTGLKKNKRKDEINLLIFIIFTIVHFATYLTFTVIKMYYTSDPFIIGFYTTFYIMNNVELILLFIYTISYVSISKKVKTITSIINFSIFGIYVLLDIINIFTHMFFSAENGVYVRSPGMLFSQTYQFIAFIIVFILTVFNKKLNKTEKIAYSLYCVLPFIAIIIQNLLPGYAIAYFSVIISIEILFLFVNVKKNLELVNEEKKSRETEIKLMMSQIQPHFIYNTLSSISTLIEINPKKAQEALDTFTEYLRANLSSLSKTGLINFEDELRHIVTYISLEKIRFEERLNVVFDVKVTDFLVPPLSIQPIVENSVKHGILQKIEGGTISIKTYETNDAYFVEIADDGVGFDIDKINLTSGDHIGINNVRYRLSTMCNGEMHIDSEIDKGTKIVVKLYK